jgi:hypothetical protein
MRDAVLSGAFPDGAATRAPALRDPPLVWRIRTGVTMTDNGIYWTMAHAALPSTMLCRPGSCSGHGRR